jgi:hypothetical protein
MKPDPDPDLKHLNKFTSRKNNFIKVSQATKSAENIQFFKTYIFGIFLFSKD